MTPEQIKTKYEPRILVILNAMRTALNEAGHNCGESFDMSSDDYRWSMIINGDDGSNGINISFIIAESEYWDGEENGVNFMVDVVEFGGRMLGGLCPYNYSNKVWVSRDDEDAIEERFRIFEQADPADIIKCVEQSDICPSA